MTTVISSHDMWKIKIVSSLATKFSSLEKSWYFTVVYIINTVYTFRFKSLHPTTHHDFLFEMRCLNSRLKLPQQTICFLYPFHVALIQLASINYGVFSDDDECQDGTHNCDSNAQCNNSAGSFTCACFQGYSGSGVVCSGKLRHQQSPNDHVFIILALWRLYAWLSRCCIALHYWIVLGTKFPHCNNLIGWQEATVPPQTVPRCNLTHNRPSLSHNLFKNVKISIAH